MAVRDVLVHLDVPEIVGSLVPEVVQPARDLGAPGLTVAALAEAPVRLSAAPLPFGLLASTHWLLSIPLSPRPAS